MADSPRATTDVRLRRSLVGPLLLVAVGVLLLLNNLGFAPWSIWATLWPYWPVLVIALGVEALATGRVPWGGLLITALLVAAGGIVFHAERMEGEWGGWRQSAEVPVSRFSQPLEGASRARVSVTWGGGRLEVGPLADDTVLAAGTLSGFRFGWLDARYEVRGEVGELTVRPRGEREFGDWRGFWSGERRLELLLNRSIPLELRINAGAADISLDLRDLRVSDLRLETGASRTTLTLPAAGATRARIEGGATSLDVRVPPGVEARVRVEGGLSDVRIDESRFARAGHEYRTANFDTAANRVDLSIALGAARVDVQ